MQCSGTSVHDQLPTTCTISSCVSNIWYKLQLSSCDASSVVRTKADLDLFKQIIVIIIVDNKKHIKLLSLSSVLLSVTSRVRVAD